MMDIVTTTQGFDLGVQDTISPKAGNLLQTQLGALHFAPNFGVDLNYFLTSNFQFQNETFKAYLIGQMIQNQINVNEVDVIVDRLFETVTWNVGNANAPLPGGFIK
jgi:hypothetical protein